jgi:hypothetical protein
MGVNGTFVTLTPRDGSAKRTCYLPACAICLNEGSVTFRLPGDAGVVEVTLDVGVPPDTSYDCGPVDEPESRSCSVCSVEVPDGLDFCIACKHPFS